MGLARDASATSSIAGGYSNKSTSSPSFETFSAKNCEAVPMTPDLVVSVGVPLSEASSSFPSGSCLKLELALGAGGVPSEGTPSKGASPAGAKSPSSATDSLDLGLGFAVGETLS